MRAFKLLMVGTVAGAGFDASAYQHHQLLAPSCNFTLYWKTVGPTMHIALQAAIGGWVSFGLADTGGMAGSDIVYGMVHDGQTMLVDAYALVQDWATPPVADCSQDWTLVAGYETNGVTTIEMTRLIDTKDAQDRVFQLQGLQPVIAAWSPSDACDPLVYHGANRISTVVDFSGAEDDPLAALRNDPNIVVVDVLMNHSIEASETVYIDQKHLLVCNTSTSTTSSSSAFEPCVDDPTGAIQAAGLTCATLKPMMSGGCDGDLHDLNAATPVGTLFHSVCPVTCNTCPSANATFSESALFFCGDGTPVPSHIFVSTTSKSAVKCQNSFDYCYQDQHTKCGPHDPVKTFLMNNGCCLPGAIPCTDAIKETTDVHIIAIEPVVQQNVKSHIHHFILDAYYNDGRHHNMYAWARGGGAVVFPQECGFRMGVNAITSLKLQTHYENPLPYTDVGILDNSGVRVYYTTKLRANDCGVVQLGDPQVRLLRTDAAGRTEFQCAVPDQLSSINVFYSFLHMHGRGTRISTHLQRGTSRQLVSANDFWNPAFQMINPKNYQIKGGDKLSTVCHHSGGVWGLASNDEMCIEFVYYWPRVSGLDGCGLGFDFGSLVSNGTTQYDNPVVFGGCTRNYTASTDNHDHDHDHGSSLRFSLGCLSASPRTAFALIALTGFLVYT